MLKQFLLIASLFFCSCSNNENTDSDNFNLLTNKWFFVKSIDLSLPENQQEYIANECEQNRFIHFNPEGQFTEQFYYKNPQDNCLDDGFIKGNFKLTNSTDLKLTSNDGDILSYKILSITNSLLSIEYLKDKEIYIYER